MEIYGNNGNNEKRLMFHPLFRSWKNNGNINITISNTWVSSSGSHGKEAIEGKVRSDRRTHRQDNKDIDNHRSSPLIMLEFLQSYVEELVRND